MSFGKGRLEQAGRTLSDGTRSRKRTRHSWFELQDTCAYHEEFSKEKLLWMDMSNEGRIAYSDDEIYCNDKGFIMTGYGLKFLCAVLNSSLVTWLMKNTSLTTGMGLMQWKKFAVQRIPIPIIDDTEQECFIQLIDDILQEKHACHGTGTADKETIIEDMVNDLFELSKREINAVSKSLATR